MKRAFWITLIAVALLILAAVGWVARLVSKPSTRETRREPSDRPRAVRLPARADTCLPHRRLLRSLRGSK